MAMVYVLKKNYDALGNRRDSKRTLIGGSVFVLLILGVLPFLPDKFPNLLIPIAYSVAAMHIAEKYQMSKQAILASQQYGLQSNWNVFGISSGWFLAFLTIGVLWMLGLGSIQDRAPKEMTFIPDNNNGKELIVRGWTRAF